MTIVVMKIELNKEIELLKTRQIEMMLQMKSSINKTKASVDSFTNRMCHVENRVSGLKTR